MTAARRAAANIRSMPRQGDWVKRAACAGMDSETFFPISYRHDRDRSDTTDRYGKHRDDCHLCKVRAICSACPVLTDCGTWAMRAEHDMPEVLRAGIFAGTTPGMRWRAERDAEQTRREQQAAAEQVPA